MGTSKALLDAGGRTFVSRLIETLTLGGCRRVVVVCSAPADPAAVAAEAAGGLVAVNPGGHGGQIRSLQVGLTSAMDHGPRAIVFTPVDNPRIRANTVEALIEAWRTEGQPIAIPAVGGQTGHPVLVDASVIPELLAEDLEEGARTVIRRDPSRVYTVSVTDPGVLDDLDTPADYARHFGPGAAP